jgi:hypothetical protein
LTQVTPIRGIRLFPQFICLVGLTRIRRVELRVQLPSEKLQSFIDELYVWASHRTYVPLVLAELAGNAAMHVGQR